MKKQDISRLKHWRPINLRIGYALSLAFIILAFSWTTERPAFEDPYADFVEIGDVELIPPTTHPEKKELPPPPEKLADNFIINPEPEPLPDPMPPIHPREPIPDPGPIAPSGELKVPAKPAPPIEKEDKKVPDIFRIVEEMPRFQGCEEEGMTKKEKYKCADGKLLTYLASNIRYPAIARENGVEGIVVISFIVEKDGSISNAEIIRNIGAGCGQEAMRVVESMPDWLPGKQRGRAVRVQYNLPVRFRLN